MAIRLATAADAPRLLGYLRATPNPPVTSERQVLQQAESMVVMLDDVTGALVGLRPTNRQQSFIWPTYIEPGQVNTNPFGLVNILWMLPRASWTADNIDDFPPVLLAALDECVRRVPASKDWPCGGEFEGEVVSDPALRLAKSREIGEFWKGRFFPEIEVKKLPDANLYRAEASSVDYLRTRLRAVMKRR